MKVICIDNKNDEHLTMDKIYTILHFKKNTQSNDLWSIKTPYYIGDDGLSYIFVESIHLNNNFLPMEYIRDKKISDLLDE
jgi:hypothetical protein